MSQQGPPADAKEAQAAAMQELEKAQKEKRKIDTTLANLESSIYAFEDSYLQESALSGGNIIKGFDNYLKPPAAINKKKMEVTNEDRLFSTSSGTFAQSIHLKNQLTLHTASLSRLERTVIAPPPPAITLLPSLRRNVSIVSNHFDCNVNPYFGMGTSVGQRKFAPQAWPSAHEVDPANTRIPATPTTGSSLDNRSLPLTVPDSSTLATANSFLTPMTAPGSSAPNAATANHHPSPQRDVKSDTDVDMLEMDGTALVEPENAISLADSLHSTRSVSKAAEDTQRTQTARGGRDGRGGQSGARRSAGGRASARDGGARGRGGRSQTASTRG